MEWFSPEIAVIIGAGLVNAGLWAVTRYIRNLIQDDSEEQKLWIEKQDYATKEHVKSELALLREQTRSEALALRNALLEREIQAVKAKSLRLLDKEEDTEE